MSDAGSERGVDGAMASASGDPVRRRLIEAMERRAAGYDGETRRLLDRRVAALRDEPRSDAGASRNAATSTMPPGELARLVAYLARQASLRHGTATIDAPGRTTGAVALPAEPQSLAYLRSTWAKLSAEKRLTRSLETVPENAGPLNSHQLVHRALKSMRDTSPGYLHHFMTYVDALLWLDQAGAAPSVAPVRQKAARSGKPAPRTR